MLDSRYSSLGAVALPAFARRQHYMIPLDLANIHLPDDVADYHDAIMTLTRSAGARSGRVFVTIDEKEVVAGSTQRRPHPHVDGCFVPEKNKWGHGGPGGAWNHYCNHLPVERMPIIVASSVAACRVWRGRIDATPSDSGDLSHARHLLDAGELVPANTGALLSPDCVHESLPLERTVERTFLRIALPTWFVGPWH